MIPGFRDCVCHNGDVVDIVRRNAQESAEEFGNCILRVLEKHLVVQYLVGMY